MMNTFRSHFMKDGEKYAPLHGDVAAADNDTPCTHCGQTARSLERNPKRLLTAIGTLLALALLVSLSIAVGRETRYVARDRTKLPFTEVFGDIPIRPKKFTEDHRFIHQDPYEGTWDKEARNDSAKRPWTVWDDLYSGSWIEIQHPWTYGLPKGGPMLKYSTDPGPHESEGYVPSINHQIHCMGELKHLLLELEKGRMPPKLDHATHCVEYLRQSIMCSADLTLEFPNDPKGIMGWGIIHQCRDWPVIREIMTSHKAIIDRD